LITSLRFPRVFRASCNRTNSSTRAILPSSPPAWPCELQSPRPILRIVPLLRVLRFAPAAEARFTCCSVKSPTLVEMFGDALRRKPSTPDAKTSRPSVRRGNHEGFYCGGTVGWARTTDLLFHRHSRGSVNATPIPPFVQKSQCYQRTSPPSLAFPPEFGGHVTI
jgi:hypothetical protein